MAYLVDEPIDVAALTAAAIDAEHGAVVSFVGVVRNHHEGRMVTALAYTAYREMAESGIASILVDAAARWPVSIDARHRLGDLMPGDPAVAVVASAVHRSEAFEAAAWVIDEIKRRVPIWKHESHPDGSTSWVEP